MSKWLVGSSNKWKGEIIRVNVSIGRKEDLKLATIMKTNPEGEYAGAPLLVVRIPRLIRRQSHALNLKKNKKENVPITQTIRQLFDRRSLMRPRKTKPTKLSAPSLEGKER